ncbi:LOW QUALITY PROTEIN: Helitron helicase [Phytophthora megakarya]|uniref:Helitron helicase n=1 Tax=Phytophthora megakarya TaxID=4795 RepID=A0A225VCU2_9STRA|nr:LOW QUALITY PROTEIN: Helitron helicase [Phytophthora megakarya]
MTPLNFDVLKLNDAAIDSIAGEPRKYVSVDTVEDAQDVTTQIESQVLLRNFNGESGLCNGTRLQVCHMDDHYIEAKVLTGILTGKVVVIPRIPLISHNSGLPFELRRLSCSTGICYDYHQGTRADTEGVRRLFTPTRICPWSVVRRTFKGNIRQYAKIAVDYNVHQEEDGYCMLNVVYHGIVN